jgi:replicative DNA helicase
MDDLTHILPHNLEAERSCLGCCILDRAAYLTVMSRVQPDEFFHPPHRIIFENIKKLFLSNITPDYVTLTDALVRSNDLAAAGGAEYIAGLTSVVPSVRSAEHYADIMHSLSVRRKLMRFCNEMYAQAHNPKDVSIEAIISGMYDKMLGLTTGPDADEIIGIDDAIFDAQAAQDQMRAQGYYTRLKTGFPGLDAIYQIQPQTLTTLGGYTSCGKSALALNIANYLAFEEIPILYITLEISYRVILYRLAALNSAVNASSYTRGHVKDLKADVGIQALGPIREYFHIADFDSASEVRIVLAMQRHMMKHPKTGLIVIDYLQNVDCEKLPRESRHRQISSIMRYFRSAAKRLEVPLLLVSQLSRPQQRDGKFRPASRYDLKESGDIETNSDNILLINKLAMEENRPVNWHGIIDVSKQNSGIQEKVEMYFTGAHMRFEEIPVPGDVLDRLKIKRG